MSSCSRSVQCSNSVHSCHTRRSQCSHNYSSSVGISGVSDKRRRSPRWHKGSVSALQRQMHAPRAVELRRLNRVIRWVQRNPHGLTYHQLPEPRVLLAVGDSAFQAPTDDGIISGRDPLVMRGYILARARRIDQPPQPTVSASTTTPAQQVPQGVATGHRQYLLQIPD